MANLAYWNPYILISVIYDIDRLILCPVSMGTSFLKSLCAFAILLMPRRGGSCLTTLTIASCFLTRTPTHSNEIRRWYRDGVLLRPAFYNFSSCSRSFLECVMKSSADIINPYKQELTGRIMAKFGLVCHLQRRLCRANTQAPAWSKWGTITARRAGRFGNRLRSSTRQQQD